MYGVLEGKHAIEESRSIAAVNLHYLSEVGLYFMAIRYSITTFLLIRQYAVTNATEDGGQSEETT